MSQRRNATQTHTHTDIHTHRHTYTHTYIHTHLCGDLKGLKQNYVHKRCLYCLIKYVSTKKCYPITHILTHKPHTGV